MTSSVPLVAEMLRDPAWLAHRYDPQFDAVHFVQANRNLRSQVPFLIDDEMKLTTEPVIVARGDAVAATRHPASVHFIFHSAYCCSTLLARAFDVPGVCSAFKEPQILNDLVGWRHRGGDPARIGAVLDASLRLLARPFDADEASVIKPSNVVNGLAGAMLSVRPQAGAVLLYAPLRSFLASIARKGMWGRLWVRELLSKQLTDGLIDLGFEPRDHILHTDLQAAAVGWMAQQQLFARLVERWPERIRTLDSEILVAQPREALSATATLFGLTLDAARIEIIVGDVFGRDAKTGRPFGSGQRATDRDTGGAPFAEEIEKVAVWAEAVAAAFGLAFDPPGALLHG